MNYILFCGSIHSKPYNAEVILKVYPQNHIKIINVTYLGNEVAFIPFQNASKESAQPSVNKYALRQIKLNQSNNGISASVFKHNTSLWAESLKHEKRFK